MPTDLGPRYELIRDLGSGGAARIYLVRDLYLKRDLALKLLHDPPVTVEELEQVEREFTLLAEIEHPGIARAHDFGYLGHRPYFTSEFVPGEPLSRSGPPAGEAALARLARDLAEALAFLHEHGILHLDIKPGNVVVSSHPGRERAVLIDFGLVRKAFTLEPGPSVKGSLPFMAPEYFRGEALGPWTDVYALGVALYAHATGTLPRVGASARIRTASGSRMKKKLLEDLATWDPVPMAPSARCAASSPDLDRIILKAIALDPTARFASGREFLEAIERLRAAQPSREGQGSALVSTVGRAAELLAAAGFLDGLARSPDSARTLLVTGPSGIGQSHFLKAIKIRAQMRGLRVYLETGYPGRASPPGSLLRALGPHVSDPESRDRWESFLAGLRRSRRPSRNDITEGERRLRRAGEVARAARTVRDAVIIAVDGLQYWDEVSIELLVALVRSLGEKGRPGEQGVDLRSPLGVIVGYREEGPSAPILGDLTDYLLQAGKGTIITLPPLGVEETLALWRSRGGRAVEGSGGLEGRRGLGVFQRTQGHPARILGLLDPRAIKSPWDETRTGNRGTGTARTVSPEAVKIICALEGLGRPATIGELAAFTHERRRRLETMLGNLEDDGWIQKAFDPAETAAEGPSAAALPGTLGAATGPAVSKASSSSASASSSSAASSSSSSSSAVDRARNRMVSRSTSPSREPRAHGDSDVEWVLREGAALRIPKAWRRERLRMRATLGRELAQAAAGVDDPRLVEAVRLLHGAGRKREVVELGLRAVGHLKASFQHRVALEVYRAVLESLPRGRRLARLQVALEIADLHSRLGDSGVQEGIRILSEVLPLTGSLPAHARARVLLRLATLHSRLGDFRRAEFLFTEGLDGVAKEGDSAEGPVRKRSRAAALPPEEILVFTNEHAAMKAIVGLYDEALELCEKGLRLAGRSRSPEIREIVLNLHATRANIALRTFDFEAAARDLECALEIAEAIGSPGNQATVLNNLGVVYNQCDRYRDAVRVYQEAERICLRLDEGPSLASVYGNLALLHAKTGDFVSMERCLEEGERLVPAVIGRRQEFFLKHIRGLCLMSRGRYSGARLALEEAIHLGRALGDRHVVAFDEVYLAEVLIYLGAYAEAHRELARIGTSASGRPRSMALARQAWLEALIGRPKEVRRLVALHEASETAQPVPYLDAWDRFYLGWALSIAGDHDRSRDLLRASSDFFESKGLVPAHSMGAWALAEERFLSGNGAAALDSIQAFLRSAGPASPDAARSPANDLAAALWPLLEARCLLASTSRASPHDVHPQDANRGDTNLRGTNLRGTNLRGANQARAADLLARSGAALLGNPLPEWYQRQDALRALLSRSPRTVLARLRKEREDLARDLPPDAHRGLLHGPYWEAWTRKGEIAPRAGSEAPLDVAAAKHETSTTTNTYVPSKHFRTAIGRSSLVAKSPGMQRLLSILDRLRRVELPVLIHGETGTGKELVARIIHEESPRKRGPFHVLDSATIPAGLLESELFGARAGAFTGIEEDRPGLLALAEGGTILVDEIAGATLEVQAKLLRVLSSGRARPLGAEEDRPVDVRFLVSTSRDLEVEVREGRFREDLYYRIRGIVVELPPLRDRPEDLEDLARSLTSDGRSPPPALGRGVVESLRKREWPGNVRELANLLDRARLESPGVITLDAIETAGREPATTTIFPRNLLAGEGLEDLKDHLERDYVVHHFHRLRGNAKALAGFLHLSRRQLYRRCQKLGILLRALRRKKKA